MCLACPQTDSADSTDTSQRIQFQDLAEVASSATRPIAPASHKTPSVSRSGKTSSRERSRAGPQSAFNNRQRHRADAASGLPETSRETYPYLILRWLNERNSPPLDSAFVLDGQKSSETEDISTNDTVTKSVNEEAVVATATKPLEDIAVSFTGGWCSEQSEHVTLTFVLSPL